MFGVVRDHRRRIRPLLERGENVRAVQGRQAGGVDVGVAGIRGDNRVIERAGATAHGANRRTGRRRIARDRRRVSDERARGRVERRARNRSVVADQRVRERQFVVLEGAGSDRVNGAAVPRRFVARNLRAIKARDGVLNEVERAAVRRRGVAGDFRVVDNDVRLKRVDRAAVRRGASRDRRIGQREGSVADVDRAAVRRRRIVREIHAVDSNFARRLEDRAASLARGVRRKGRFVKRRRRIRAEINRAAVVRRAIVFERRRRSVHLRSARRVDRAAAI